MNILEEADQIINGDREQTYGRPGINLERIAKGWEVILGVPVEARKVALCMAWLKIAREVHKPKRDNLVDCCGYIALIDKMESAKCE